jgi:nucleotide-binding universal stress UspA family protein
MFNTILVPTDGSPLAGKAIQAAVEFAKLNNCKVIGLAVAEPYPYSPLAEPAFLPDPAAYEKGVLEYAQLHVQAVQDAADKLGVPCTTLTAMADDPAQEIVQTAIRQGCDIIFMASHGRRGIDRLLLGSVTQNVLVHSRLPVLVFR